MTDDSSLYLNYPDAVATSDESAQQIAGRQNGVAAAASRLDGTPSNTGIDELDKLLNKHLKNTRDDIDESGETLDKTRKGMNGILNEDRESATPFKTTLAGSQTPQAPPPQAASAMMPAPQPSPAASMPAPATPAAYTAGMHPISPQALAALLTAAGVTPESAAAPRPGGGKTEKLENVQHKQSGTRKLGPAELAADIDAAADAAGIPRDKTARAEWHALYRFLIEKESSSNPDAIQQVKDVNWSGPPASDGAPENAARGLTQLRPSTFAAFHVAGTSDNIYDRVANIAASMRYVIEHYGVEPTPGPKFEQFVARRHANGYTGY